MSEGAIHQSAEPIRVLIAEDDPGARQALAELISGDDQLIVIGQAGNAKDAAAMASRFQPDVALLDVRMPFGGGPKAAREIRERSPGTRVLALSMLDDRSAVLEMIRAGAVGYLVKTEPPGLIIDAIQTSARGDGALSERVTTKVVRELAGQLRREERRSQARRVRVHQIRDLMRHDDLKVVFQPIQTLVGRETKGFEALARVRGRHRRSPLVWLADAEAVGLRIELELAMIQNALDRFDDLPADVFLSLNLSAPTALSPLLIDVLAAAPPGRVVLEVTEHQPVDQYDQLVGALAPLRARGIRLAVDDAGAGFASLRHVVRLGPDFIKLDIALTRDIATDQAQRALASALIAFADEIGATIIAEGVETQAQLDTLLRIGITLGQGYYLSRPRPSVSRIAPEPRSATL
jgi:EAL domain-containing protein (putative c-di-GMP-specific phosphodiesterase class I)/AmiR/NasT family two-component response regulator